MMKRHPILKTPNCRVLISEPFRSGGHRIPNTLIHDTQRSQNAPLAAVKNGLPQGFDRTSGCTINKDRLILLDKTPCRRQSKFLLIGWEWFPSPRFLGRLSGFNESGDKRILAFDLHIKAGRVA